MNTKNHVPIALLGMCAMVVLAIYAALATWKGLSFSVDATQLVSKLSPLLLIRNPNQGPVVIADGYHRLCAIYSFDEDAVIPCKIC